MFNIAAFLWTKLRGNNCAREAAAFYSSGNATGHFATKLKSFDEIPRKSGILPAVLDLVLAGGPAKLHEHCHRRHKQLGPIYTEYLGPIELVFLSDTKLIQSVIANEGQFPHHNVPRAWSYFNKLHNIERGLFFQVGEPWAKLRKAFSKVMLADQRKITRFSGDILHINRDLLNHWDKRAKSSGATIIDNVKPDLCKWSIEATCFILFGRRLGCLDSTTSDGERAKDSRAGELVESVSKMFEETSKFQLLPVELAHRFNLPVWRRFELASENMLKIAGSLANEYIAKIKTPSPDSEAIANSLTKDLMDCDELTDDEVSRSLVDLIIAATDTTSNSLQWMLYLIAKHRDIQAKLFEEAKILLTSNNLEEDVENLHHKASYLRAFVKEVFRLYPVAPFLARTLDKDISLASYRVPKGKTIVFSLFTTSRMDEYFDEPNEFKPERWLKNSRLAPDEGGECPSRAAKNHAYASLPFGIGLRKCIGRRAAELELSLFLASFVTRFESSLLNEDEELGIKLEMILCPTKPIRIKLKPRTAQF